jgi:hypothetical protein
MLTVDDVNATTRGLGEILDAWLPHRFVRVPFCDRGMSDRGRVYAGGAIWAKCGWW